MRLVRMFVLPLLLLLSARAAVAEEPLAAYRSLATPLLDTGQTVLGQQIAYPPGTAKVTAVIVVMAPGQQTGWHIHQVPLISTILDGALTVDYGSKGIKVFKQGDTTLEAVNWPHNGMNKGTVPVRLLVVYMGAEGMPIATPVNGPQ